MMYLQIQCSSSSFSKVYGRCQALFTTTFPKQFLYHSFYFRYRKLAIRVQIIHVYCYILMRMRSSIYVIKLLCIVQVKVNIHTTQLNCLTKCKVWKGVNFEGTNIPHAYHKLEKINITSSCCIKMPEASLSPRCPI